ncbi:hypothetical protein PHLGIDRAFT_470503 [Phlebiopsis gigantea 11061_1 CR5-6]|uniref:Uncharacterized protein n=1 Tax=Phlebiopsis gigantea (strain 11061_1 CR5-6) TaxID=745531 RepID=A0A0C3NM28_PHLG1|nr:hypothetical protein PHLGIDRAFT_470503 [Phlebiopsis gigantea 11061_1 CR5-6]
MSTVLRAMQPDERRKKLFSSLPPVRNGRYTRLKWVVIAESLRQVQILGPSLRLGQYLPTRSKRRVDRRGPNCFCRRPRRSRRCTAQSWHVGVACGSCLLGRYHSFFCLSATLAKPGHAFAMRR